MHQIILAWPTPSFVPQYDHHHKVRLIPTNYFQSGPAQRQPHPLNRSPQLSSLDTNHMSRRDDARFRERAPRIAAPLLAGSGICKVEEIERVLVQYLIFRVEVECFLFRSCVAGR